MPHHQNPLLAQWLGPYGLPPFGAVAAAHYRPAFEEALAEHRAEIDRIAQNPSPPDFDNTIAALEDSGRLSRQVGAVFWNLYRTDSTPELEEIEREISGVLARHASETSMNAALFARIDALYARRGALGLELMCKARTAKKKTDVAEHPQVFDHVGLLVDGLPGTAGSPFI